LDVPLVKNVPGKLSEVATKYRTLESPDVDLARAREELTTSPLYRNVVISPDARTTAIRVVLSGDEEYRELQFERGRLLYARATGTITPEEEARLAEIEPRYD